MYEVMHCVVVIIRVQSANYHLHMWFHSVHKVTGWHWERLFREFETIEAEQWAFVWQSSVFCNVTKKQMFCYLCFYNRNSVNHPLCRTFCWVFKWLRKSFFQNNIYWILEFEIYITNKFSGEVEIDLTVVYVVN